MKLKSLHIFASGYGTQERLTGSIEFTMPAGEFKFTLEQKHIQGILSVIADSMVDATKELADNLTAEIIEHTPFLLAGDSHLAN